MDATCGGTLITTDIHTHLTGAPGSADLLRLGLQHDLTYPASMLRFAGIVPPADIRVSERDTVVLPGGIPAPAEGSPTVRLRDLAAETLAGLANAMDMPPQISPGQEPFAALEHAYSIRRPLAAHPLLLPDILRLIADGARADNVTYLELSASAPLLDPPSGGPPWLDVASRTLNAVRAQTGLRMVMLATVNRHTPPASLPGILGRLEDAMAAYPFLVGIDIAGHETNASAEFMPALEPWASARVRRGLPTVVRVHAGETPHFPTNVMAALHGFRSIGLPPGMGRIGHALYGVGRNEVALARDTEAVIEMSLASNRILGYRSAPSRSGGGLRLARLIRAGVTTVLGTDGGGIYRTSSAQEAARALSDGAGLDVLAEVSRHEQRHLTRMRDAFPLALQASPLP